MPGWRLSKVGCQLSVGRMECAPRRTSPPKTSATTVLPPQRVDHHRTPQLRPGCNIRAAGASGAPELKEQEWLGHVAEVEELRPLAEAQKDIVGARESNGILDNLKRDAQQDAPSTYAMKACGHSRTKGVRELWP